MKLFPDNPSENLLPHEGEVYYHGPVLTVVEADKYYKMLFENCSWRNDEAILFGKKIITARKVAWYGNKPFPYRYSGTVKVALPWSDELKALKLIVEQLTGETFNSCLLNLYHSGEEGMAWHSDSETDLLKNGAIASLSLGAERKFALKHKRDKEVVSIFLAHGSLLVMKGVTQSNWLHRLPPTKKVNAGRINLTFRTMTK